MLNSTERLLNILLSDVFPSWLSCEPVRYLLAFVFIALIVKFVISFLKF